MTGVQKVMMDVHHALTSKYNAKIVGTIPFDKVHTDHHINRNEYVKCINPFMFYHSIVIIHERKLLLPFWILNHLLFQRIKIVYIHHNEFHNHKFLTILPNTIVAISDRGRKNLIEFFDANPKHIHKIHNCVIDKGYVESKANKTDDTIKLIYPARINNQKQQIELVKHLEGKIDKNIKITFVGIGPKFEELKELCVGKENFEVLGYRNDVIDLIRKSDYTLLYSANEGLPITLIESSMVGKPIICSNVGGNNEICEDGANGWIITNWEDLIKVIKSLKYIPEENYINMSHNSRSIYEQKFTFKIFQEKYLQLIDSIS